MEIMFNKNIKGEWRYQFDSDRLEYDVYSKDEHICTLMADDTEKDYPIKEHIAEAISLLPELIDFYKKTLKYLGSANENKDPDLLIEVCNVKERIEKGLGLMDCGCISICSCI